MKKNSDFAKWYAQGYGKFQGRTSKVSSEPWQQELAKARKSLNGFPMVVAFRKNL